MTTQLTPDAELAAIQEVHMLLHHHNLSALISEWSAAYDASGPKGVEALATFKAYANLVYVGPKNDWNSLRSTAESLMRRIETEVLRCVFLRSCAHGAKILTVEKILERSTKPDGVNRAFVKLRDCYAIVRWDVESHFWQVAYSWDTLEMCRAAWSQWFGDCV
jgi:hypothetical protein